MKVTTSDRLKYLMETRNLRQADILEKIQPYCKKYGVKIPRNALSQYVTGKVLPKQDKLTILGLALGVSEVWLMGYDVPMERETPAPPHFSYKNTCDPEIDWSSVLIVFWIRGKMNKRRLSEIYEGRRFVFFINLNNVMG